MLKVGLTGGIGSGKSTVAKIFELLEVPVFYSDNMARELINADKSIISKIKEHFGEKSYTEKGLNRSHIASLVFNNNEKLALLNSITHPAIIQAANEWMQQQKTVYSIKEAALIFESGSDKYLDYIIGVFSPIEIRLQRVKQRDNATDDEIRQRMDRQMNEEEKMKRCNFVVFNNEEQLLIPQVIEIHHQLLTKSQ